MRIYGNFYELMSETGRNLWEMGVLNQPKTYQNKNIEGNEEFITKEMICEQYCLTGYDDMDILFHYSNSKQWAEAEFQERVAGKPINPGEAWKLRKDVWEEFLNHDHKFDYTYSQRMMAPTEDFTTGRMAPALRAVVDLLNHDHDTRKAVLPIFWKEDLNWLDGSRRIPCSMYYDFLVREVNGEEVVNMTYHQRSSDFVTHFGNDVWLAISLMKFVANKLELKPGYLYHSIDSLHVYKKDWDSLKNGLLS